MFRVSDDAAMIGVAEGASRKLGIGVGGEVVRGADICYNISRASYRLRCFQRPVTHKKPPWEWLLVDDG